jgi:hypothetical protein
MSSFNGPGSQGESELENSEKICPVCRHNNEPTAHVCGNCGAALDEGIPGSTVTAISTEVPAGGPVLDPGDLVDRERIPVDGIAVYAAGSDKPVYVRVENELVLGRKVNETVESMLDLTQLGGFQLGLSRRHAMVRRTGTGFELLDLASTNGTWLNNEPLVPNTPYPLVNGSQVRLGRMRLFLFFRSDRAGQSPRVD